MRIGIDARFYGSIGKGLGRYTEKLITSLEQIDPVNQYVIFLRRENFDEYVPSHENFTKVLADYAWYGWQEQLRLPFLLYRYRLDLVHFPHFNIPILYWGKFVVTVHDLILFHFKTAENTTLGWAGYAGKYLLYRLTIAIAVWRAVSVLTVSRFTRDDIAHHYKGAEEKLVVTMEAADHRCSFMDASAGERTLHRFGLKEDGEYGRIREYFLYVGNAYPHKNLEAIIHIATLFPSYRFVFVGKEDFFYRRLRKATVGIENIIFTGFVPDFDLSFFYRKAIAYLFPSRYEGFGLPGLEAMQYGLPVIASNQGSLPEVYGDAAIFFDPTVEGDMERVLRDFLRYSEEERASLRADGFARAGQFHWSDMAKATLAVYEKSGHSH
jgi:glycosyltransferase involved in cell wall biosynthesis